MSAAVASAAVKVAGAVAHKAKSALNRDEPADGGASGGGGAAKPQHLTKWIAGFCVVVVLAIIVGTSLAANAAMETITNLFSASVSGLNLAPQPPYSKQSVEAWSDGDLDTVRKVCYENIIPWPVCVAVIETNSVLKSSNPYAWDTTKDAPDMTTRVTAWANALAEAKYGSDAHAALLAVLDAPTGIAESSVSAILARSAEISMAANADEDAPLAPEYTDDMLQAIVDAADESIPVFVPVGDGTTGTPGGSNGVSKGGWGGYNNGMIPASAMAGISFAPGQSMRSDAAAALEAMNVAYTAQFGRSIAITDSYRSYAGQVAVRATKGRMAAVPGTSNHGWALALDLGGGINKGNTAQHAWMDANAGNYGFVNPLWAKTSKIEPWHWEYIR